MKSPFLLAPLLLFPFLWPASAQAPAPRAQAASGGPCEQALARLSAALARTQILQARFRHALHSRALGQDEVEEGTLTLARGGKMRWDYSTPPGKLAVSDGKTSYLYLPGEKTVYVQPLPRGADAPLPLRLLMGTVRPEEEFQCQGAVPQGDLVELILSPRQPVEGVKEVRVTVEEATGEVREVRYDDALGNEVSLTLEDVRHPASEPDSLFRFTAPEGARVVEGG